MAIIGEPIIAAKLVSVDSALSDSSLNPVQNKVIKTALDGKVNTEQGKGLSQNDFTNALKGKLDNIEAEANKTVVDASLSGSSTNPVQNKAVKAELDKKVDLEDYYIEDDDADKTYMVTKTFQNGFLVEHFEEVTA